MAGAGVSGYAAINARVRAMVSKLLSVQQLGELREAEDFSSLVGLLKQTVYGTYLENLNDKETTPRRVLKQTKERLADAYFSVIHMAPDHARPLLAQLYRYYEVGNLKAILRGIVPGPDKKAESHWELVQNNLFPLGAMTVLPAQEMVEAGNVAAAVDLLHGTRYEETLSFAMKRYNAEQNLFPLEVALDLAYWRQLWSEAKGLSGLDREYALRIIGSLMDMNNLMWAIRYRVYHRLSEEELINYTLPFGYHLRDEDVRAIAAGIEISSVVQRVYPDLTDINALLEQPHSGLPLLEARLKRYVVRQCKAAFAGNPFHVGVPLAFLVLTDLETQDLTVLIEGKSSLMPESDYRPFMLQASAG